MPCSRLSDLLPPAEIVKAAERVRVWMEVNGYRNWQLSGICDRRIAADRDRLRDTLRTISVSDWKTSGELRCMARLAESSANTKIEDA